MFRRAVRKVCASDGKTDRRQALANGALDDTRSEGEGEGECHLHLIGAPGLAPLRLRGEQGRI